MGIIIIGKFKDTKQTHYINKNNTTDSLMRTRVKEYASRFKTEESASKFLDEMRINNPRYNECIYSCENE